MLRRHRLDDGFTAYRSPLLEGLGVPHAFTTRRGPGGTAFDVGALERCAAHLRRLAGAGDVPVADARQVHGAGVRRLDEPGAAFGPPPEADALVTGLAALVLVRTADCVPVLVAGEDGGRVAAVHAGWRGLVAGVLPRALDALEIEPGRGVAAVGPCLSLARFEVGPEVAEAFVAAGLGAAVHARPAGRPHVDLRAAATLQLERGGVRRIDLSTACTWEDADEFYSHRRDVTHGPLERTGRLAAVIGPRSAAL